MMVFSEEFKQTKEYIDLLRKNKEWYNKNKEIRKKKMRDYWNEHKNERKELKKEYYELNKQDIKTKSKEYREGHKDHLKKYSKSYWEKNKEVLNKKNKQRNIENWKTRTPEQKEEYRLHKNIWEKNKKKEDIQFAVKKRLRLRVWQSFKGIRKQTSDELGIDYDDIVKHLNKTLPIDYKLNPSKYEIDHIIPLCSFDLTNSEEAKKAFAPNNHQWLLAEDNAKKTTEDISYKKNKETKMNSETKTKEVPYMQKENLDTTFSSLWLWRGNNPVGNKFNNIVLTDEIANMSNGDDGISTVRTSNGINYYSSFSPILADNIISYWSKEGDVILDPFSGRTRSIISAAKKRIYHGFEIAKEVHDVVIKSIETNRALLPLIPQVYNDDCINMCDKKYNIPDVDLVFSCPPYFNIEAYPSCNGQLSDIDDYHVFLEAYKERMKACCSKLKKGGYVVLVVGDFRIDSKFYCFHGDTINVMKSLGLNLHDVVIRQSVTFNRATRRFGVCRKTKITAKVHEYILVFKK
jgi:DNA modification methylase